MLQIFIIENDDTFRKTVNKYVHQIRLKQDMKAKIIYSGKNITEFMKALKSSDENSFNLYFFHSFLNPIYIRSFKYFVKQWCYYNCFYYPYA